MKNFLEAIATAGVVSLWLVVAAAAHQSMPSSPATPASATAHSVQSAAAAPGAASASGQKPTQRRATEPRGSATSAAERDTLCACISERVQDSPRTASAKA
jgi:hypothetical protein